MRFKILFIYLREREREREHMHTVVGEGRGRSRFPAEQGARLAAQLNPRKPRPLPKPKADA